jgi:membrane-bound lytic murein transglycosylase A
MAHLRARVWLIALCLCMAGAECRADEFDQLPGWRTERFGEVARLFAASCPRLPASFRAACAGAQRVPAGDEDAARRFLEASFRPSYLGQALTTGYFELDVTASRTQGGAYQWPLLRPPPDPRRYDRAAILSGALAGRGLEMLWFSSPSDLYFVQLQGSARVRLTDGGVMRVGGAAQNGFASIPTARLFNGVGIPGNDLSIPGIRTWIAAHPREGAALLNRDPAYFFMAERSLRADQGPLGALGVPLEPLRSVAVDAAHVPLGTPMWIDTRISALRQPLQRIMLAQDTGEPISGAAHVDIFFGPGADAEAVGGRQHAMGGVWVLAPR